MTPGQLEAHRDAAFLRYLSEQLAEEEDSKNLADWLVDVAVELIKSALGMESTRESSFTDRDDIAEIAARVVMLITDIQLGRRGKAAGYYSAGFDQRVSTLLHDTARDSLAELLTTVSDSEYELEPSEDEHIQLERLDKFVSDLAIWRDASTPCFVECLKYLVFANADQWQRQLDEVKELASAMQANPTLHLSSKKADGYAWVLDGATDLSYFLNAFGWPVMLGPRESLPEAAGRRRIYLPAIDKLFSKHDVLARYYQLVEVRAELVTRSQYLTSDASIQTAAWFLAQADPEDAAARDDVWFWGV